MTITRLGEVGTTNIWDGDMLAVTQPKNTLIAQV